MIDQALMDFVIEVFKKNQVSINRLTREEFFSFKMQNGIDIGADIRKNNFVQENLHKKSLFIYQTALGVAFRFFALPGKSSSDILLIGPYLPSQFSDTAILELAEKLGIYVPKSSLEYMHSLPVLTYDCQLFIVLNSFCEKIFSTKSFKTHQISSLAVKTDKPIDQTMRDITANDVLINMKVLEHRYALENEIIRGVETGSLYLESRFKNLFDLSFFEDRASDPLRNTKNYSIIMNTLLRKAAERAGVHPIHIDRVSSSIAKEIEDFSDLSKTADMMGNIFKKYCNLVIDQSIKDYSEVVKKAILIIDADISSDLTPGNLAKALKISSGYLSSVFMKDLNKTPCQYIRERRMEYAAYLLSTSNLQIQSIAMQCGIMDLQYFSKQFKKYYGKTPTEYRNTVV